MFLAFINDLPESVKGSDPRLFGDDCLLYKIINCDADAEAVQQDLLALEEWERKWQKRFHPENASSSASLPLNASRDKQNTGFIGNGKYLGVTISNDLSWHRHVDAVAAKASRTLGFLRRNLGQCTTEVKSTVYTSLVRPVLDYASPAWDTTCSDDIVKLEKVQRQAARFVHGNYTERNPGCVNRMVKDLGWETLENRRKKDRLTTLYKIRHGAIDMDTGDVLCFNDRQRSTETIPAHRQCHCIQELLLSQNRLRLESPTCCGHRLPDHRGVQSRPRSPAADSQKLRDNHVFNCF